ncbi:MAG: type IX secretion system membrane protein PorP/SprF [Filimonas sp.]|nr:type IX secretion system membrane protein PorP/SprF [Filimonas sp.]
MKSAKYFLLSIIFGGSITTCFAQQDIQFSQYVFNGLAVNPAYAGYRGDLYLNSTYRKQWVGIPGSPQTAVLSVDGLTRVKDDKVAVAGQVMWDKLGPQESLSFYGTYAFRIPLDNTGLRRLCLGLSAGVTQYSLDGTVLQYTDPNDPDLPTVKASTIVPDANFGIYYYTPNFYAGLSFLDMFSLNQDRSIYYSGGFKYATIRKSPHVYLTAGTMVKLSETVQLKPSILIKEDFKGPTSVDFNLLALFVDKIWIGGSYRTGISWSGKSGYQPDLESSAAVSAMMEFFATENLRIGYSYDFTTNGLSNYQNGSHEISLGIRFPGKRNADRIWHPRYF